MTGEPRGRLLVIVGPTAAGKSEQAVALARALDGEVISADSMQVYRHFDIGTGKLSPAERRGVPHHLIDVVEPTDRYSAARFVEDADDVAVAIARRGRLPIVAGGTGLYVKALLHGLFEAPPVDAALRREHQRIRDARGLGALRDELRRVDPRSADSIDPNDFVRISRALEVWQTAGRTASSLRDAHRFAPRRYGATVIGLQIDPQTLRRRIDARVEAMLAAGWLEEVGQLRAAGYVGTHPMGALGYRQLDRHLRGELDLDQAVWLTKRDTWRFSRRQRNWFRREDAVSWVPFDRPLDPAEVVSAMERQVRRERQG